jgi:hypothetical protein
VLTARRGTVLRRLADRRRAVPDQFGMLWFESEYVIDTAAKWIVVGNAVNTLVHERPAQPPTGPRGPGTVQPPTGPGPK